MKYLLLVMSLFVGFASASTHQHIPGSYGGENDLDAWSLGFEASVPIEVSHEGPDTRYYIEVNNMPVSAVFIMTDHERLKVDVPVQLEDRHGGQNFKVCSVALHGTVGTRICTEAELFLIK